MHNSTNLELDRLISEKVMGLVPCDNWEPINLGAEGGPAMLKKCHLHHNCYAQDQPMAYSTLIDAAWQIVEHLAERDWEVTIKRLVNANTIYEVTVDKHSGDGEDRFTADAASAPQAICLSALRASGYNGPLP